MVDVRADSEKTYAAKRCGVQAQLTHKRPETNFKFKDLDAQLERDFPYRVKPPNPEHQHFVFTNSRVYY